MIKIGLTGSIAMGKSYVGRLFSYYKIPFFSYDDASRYLVKYDKKIIRQILQIFPEAREGDSINREKLAQIVFDNKKLLIKLERIIHPAIDRIRNQFYKSLTIKRTKLVVDEVPLLFERKYEKNYDLVIVATASKLFQKRRALLRTGMTTQKLKSILKTQMNDSKKRMKCDYLIHTGAGKALPFREMKALINQLNNLRNKKC